ncbi:MAG TPA: glucose-6-phosphate dehydrogenase assembly protein OpcA [Candidatus Eisenbacteria bacterium]|nr:glucose-6-phosphate dehydrogenase assembly protein OpcA [Candidatus Eisenbacteria bacterium]
MNGAAAPTRLDHVPLEDIESELRALWRGLSESEPSEGRPAITRVVSMNLVILAGTESDADRALELSVQIAGRHPSRVILVRSRAGADDVSASISILCHGVAGDRQVCSEQIHLVTAGHAALRIAQHVAPLFVADVPVVLWLPNHPLVLPVDEDLLALADRIVVDARAFPEAEAALDKLSTWMESRRAVVDLAWLRLERWRALTAQFFGEAEARQDLDTIEKIEVRYRTSAEGTPEGRVEGLYYLAWLMGRLGGRWEHAASREGGAEGEHFVAVRANDKKVEMSLVATARPTQARGDLAGVKLVCDDGRCHYEIARVAELDVAEVRVRASRACPEPMRVGFPTRDPLELLSLAVGGAPDDPLYEQALRGARALAEGH